MAKTTGEMLMRRDLCPPFRALISERVEGKERVIGYLKGRGEDGFGLFSALFQHSSMRPPGRNHQGETLIICTFHGRTLEPRTSLAKKDKLVASMSFFATNVHE